MDVKQEIKELLSNVDRIKDTNLLDDLDELGYYNCPASTNKHLAIKGGLAIHSFNVYLMLKHLNEIINLNLTNDFIVVVGLLHDVCKIGTYEDNVLKNGSISESKPYKYNDKLPFGHGEKSVYIINKYFQLTDEEAMAIRYHIGPFEFDTTRAYNFQFDYIKKTEYWVPIMATYHADSLASQLLEHNNIYFEAYKSLYTSNTL